MGCVRSRSSRVGMALFLVAVSATSLGMIGPGAIGAGADNEVSTLQQVRIANDGTFDRVVFEFLGGAPATTLIGPDANTGTVEEDPSGRPVAVAGAQVVTVRMEGAIAMVNTVDSTIPLYSGPTSFSPTDTANIAQVTKTGEFEGVMRWAIGMRSATVVTVQTMTNPDRVVVDVAHAAAVPATPVVQKPKFTG
jgi:hypothetical protein